MIISGASCISVKILDNSYAKDGGTAPVGGLYELSLDISRIQQKGKTYGDGNAAEGSHEAENHHFGIHTS